MPNTSDKYITDNKLAAANKSPSLSKKQTVPSREDGTVGIRSTLTNMGISNDLIGYDDRSGTVTLGGRTLMKPSYMDENAGVSYASPSEIQNSLVSYYSKSNNPIVQVSDAYSKYAGQYGVSADALGYSNGSATIGGRPLKTLYTDENGKAWAYQNDIEDLTSDYFNTLGVSTPNEILDEYNNRYLNSITNLSRSIMNRKDFEYDPDDDPVYQAYKEKYLTEGNRASQDAMANYAGLTGGYGNSAAATAAAQTNQYYMSKLGEMVPELAQQAYERYADSYNTDINLLENMLDTYNSAYSNAYGANNKTISNINSVLASNTDRDKAAYENYWNTLFNQQKYDKNEQDYRWTEANNSQDYNWNEVLNGQESTQNNLDIEDSRMDNVMKQIYMQYYNQIINNQLNSERLNNRLTEERINQLMLQNAIGY